jgi:hypothetical protein
LPGKPRSIEPLDAQATNGSTAQNPQSGRDLPGVIVGFLLGLCESGSSHLEQAIDSFFKKAMSAIMQTRAM